MPQFPLLPAQHPLSSAPRPCSSFLASPRRGGMLSPRGLSAGTLELDSGAGSGSQGPRSSMKSSPCCRQCQLPSNCLWQMVARRVCQSLPQLKIHPDDNRSILKRYNALPMSFLVCEELCWAGSLWASDFVREVEREHFRKGTQGQAPWWCLEKCRRGGGWEGKTRREKTY